VKPLLHKLFSWCPLYRMAIGGYWYYSYVREGRCAPTRFCSYGRDVRIGRGTIIESPEKMKIGDHTWIGANCAIDATGGLRLGNYCAVAARTTILTTDHHYKGAESLPWDEARIVKPVVLEDYVWVGLNVSILPGVTIGEGAIIGLGAVVAKDIPSCAITVGNPARVVGYRDREEYDALKNHGAIRPPSLRCERLRIPPEMREKYRGLLKEVGYNVDTGEEYFELKRED
jgi:acetyltransferase-like isoleucine patch superfamily enzyme